MGRLCSPLDTFQPWLKLLAGVVFEVAWPIGSGLDVDVSILIHAVVCKDLLAASYLTMGIGENSPGKKEYEFKGWNPMEHCAAGVENLSLMLTCPHVP